MGHVDHAKTSVLDVLRKANVVSGEFDITQHIGAYQITHEKNKITFIDTGHSIYWNARRFKLTDIVILVVTADDVKPQTIESIKHTKTAKLPIVVAINKYDLQRPIHKNQNQLLEYELIAEDLSGDTLMVEITKKKKIGQISWEYYFTSRDIRFKNWFWYWCKRYCFRVENWYWKRAYCKCNYYCRNFKRWLLC